MNPELEIEIGKTYYGSGKTPRHRFVVGFDLYFVLYKTVSSKRTTSGIPIWDFKKWAKGEVVEGKSNEL